MINFLEKAKWATKADVLASQYLEMYFKDKTMTFPINPFQMLSDFGIILSLNCFDKLEGVYIPASGKEDIPIVGINSNRPITRQRFTAAHELCHHLKDSDRTACPITGKKDCAEKFADNFAAALLMPIKELKEQVKIHIDPSTGYVDFDGVLEISEYFGVSFESCLYRLAFKLRVIEGDTDIDSLRKRSKDFKPENRRKKKKLTYTKLYAQLIDAYSGNFLLRFADHARLVFQKDYIYNDIRLEGISTSLQQAAEIVTDLRVQRKSKYRKEEYEPYLSVAGHYEMYQHIFEEAGRRSCSVFEIKPLHQRLYAYYPHPEFGGQFRESDAVITGAKVDVVPYAKIISELMVLEKELPELFDKREQSPLSEFVKGIVRIHHRLTKIHPFPDGNGRTLRAFLNVMLMRGRIYPIYIKVEEKKDYIKALSVADTTGSYDVLYECIFKCLLRSIVDLSKSE